MNILTDMRIMLDEIERALPTMKWESIAGPTDSLAHFTGRSEHWVVQLVVLDGAQRMAAATSGSNMIKLTDALAEKAETAARLYLRPLKWTGGP